VSRYSLPLPTCTHGAKFRVTSHIDLLRALKRGSPHASTLCCDRDGCLADAKAWVWASTHRTAKVVPLR
jgi:hypothetical protein